MPEIVRSIIGRFCRIIGKHHHARRHELRLPLTLSLHDCRTHRAYAATTSNRAATIAGHTRNISDTGLSLILPSVRFGNRYLMDGDLTLEIELEFPAGPINFQVAPVCYDALDENQMECGYLVGLRITKITDAERQRLSAYLRQTKPSAPPSPKTAFAQNAQTL
ncbi:MAG TPA: PilZ domain-containing protein [Pyrinomonadaceae bacterium]|jgi:hypothetical protein|nr:PilZ domain-containing protein [Pyrinomonadaceae bacterium]